MKTTDRCSKIVGKLKELILLRGKVTQRTIVNNYDNELIANYVSRKTQDARLIQGSQNFSAINYRYFVPFAFLPSDRALKVLDFGGGAGHHFYSMVDTILHKVVCWTVVETRSMVASATKLNTDDRLNFEDSLLNIADVEYDLILASSSIQYSLDPLKTLNELINIESRYIFITRMPVWEFPTKTLRQKSALSSNGPGRQLYELNDGIVEYELTILNRELFESYFENRYETIFRSLETEGVHQIDGKLVHQYGYLLRRKD